jgi:ribosome maturation factor RimP
MAKKDQLEALLAPAVRSLGLELWGVELALSRSRGLLRIYIDRPQRPVTLDDCEAASREISALLDVNDPISGNYTLEVSSPGIDRPLFAAAQYPRFVGEALRVQTLAPIGNRRKFQGKLVAADGEGIVLSVDGVDVRLRFSDIDKTRLMPQFEAAVRPGKGKGKSDE